MTVDVKHVFVSPKADGVDPTLVQPSNWNASHSLQLSSGNVIGRLSSGIGAAEEIPISILSGERNRIQNGNQILDQRNVGSSVVCTNDAKYITDRFRVASSGLTTQTVSAQRVTATLSDTSNSLKITIGTGSAPGNAGVVQAHTSLEGIDWADLLWGTANASPCSIQFKVKATGITGNVGFAIRNAAFTRSYVASFSVVSGVEALIKIENVPGCTDGVWAPGVGQGVILGWDLGTGSDHNTTSGSWQVGNFTGLTGGQKLVSVGGATIEISNVCVNKGTQCIQPKFKSYADTLAECLRYYSGGVVGGLWNTSGFNTAQFPVIMRRTPDVQLVDAFGQSAPPLNAVSPTFIITGPATVHGYFAYFDAEF